MRAGGRIVTTIALAGACACCVRPQARVQESAFPATQSEPISGVMPATADSLDDELQAAAAARKALSEELSTLVEEFKRALWYVYCGPERLHCGLLFDTVFTDTFVWDFSASVCHQPRKKKAQTLTKGCLVRLHEGFEAMITERYSAGRAEDVARQCDLDPEVCNHAGRHQLAWLQSHDEHIQRQFDARRGELEVRIVDVDRRVQAGIQRLRDRLENANEAARERLASEERDLAALREHAVEESSAPRQDGWRAALGAVAAGLQTYANARSPAGPAAPLTTASPSNQAECTSDFTCGYGSRCLKGFGQVSGICAREVTPYGVPTFAPPRSDSVAPGRGGDCSFDAQCPVGFRCSKSSGQLAGFCVK